MALIQGPNPYSYNARPAPRPRGRPSISTGGGAGEGAGGGFGGGFGGGGFMQMLMQLLQMFQGGQGGQGGGFGGRPDGGLGAPPVEFQGGFEGGLGGPGGRDGGVLGGARGGVERAPYGAYMLPSQKTLMDSLGSIVTRQAPPMGMRGGGMPPGGMGGDPGAMGRPQMPPAPTQRQDALPRTAPPPYNPYESAQANIIDRR